MRRLLWVVLILILPSLCYGGSARRFMSTNSLHWQTTLQGKSVIDGTTIADSATETIPLYVGQQISFNYSATDDGAVWLSIDGTALWSSGSNTTGTASYTAPGGSHVVLIAADPGAIGTAYASNIRIPRSGTPPAALADWTSKPPAGTALRASGWQVDGLVGVWAFNEGSGTTVANAVGGATSTLGSGVSWSSGKLALSGSTNSVLPIGLSTPSGPMTIVSGFAAASKSNNLIAQLAGSTINTYIGVPANSANNRPLILLGSSNYRYFTAPADITAVRSWAFVVPGSAQTDISSSECYADGTALSAYSTLATGAQASRTTLQIGNTSATYAAQGTMDYYLVYNVVKTSAEIASLVANPWQIFAPH